MIKILNLKEIFSLLEGIFKETESKFYNALIGLSDLKCFIVLAFIVLTAGVSMPEAMPFTIIVLTDRLAKESLT